MPPIHLLEISRPYYEIFFITMTFVFIADIETNLRLKQKKQYHIRKLERKA